MTDWNQCAQCDEVNLEELPHLLLPKMSLQEQASTPCIEYDSIHSKHKDFTIYTILIEGHTCDILQQCSTDNAHVSTHMQVDAFKYIVQADGNCAAWRLRMLLASDSAVFIVASNEMEWYYDLLQPFRCDPACMTDSTATTAIIMFNILIAPRLHWHFV